MEEKEIWIDIQNYEGIYQISNLGNVKSLARLDSNNHRLKEKIMKSVNHNSGYLQVCLSKNNNKKLFLIHQLVAVAFLGHKINGFKIVINHKDENKLNNKVENIELVSNRYNTIYSSKSSLGFTGVSKNDKKYRARIQINEKITHIGTFDTPEQASEAYQKAYQEQENEIG